MLHIQPSEGYSNIFHQRLKRRINVDVTPCRCIDGSDYKMHLKDWAHCTGTNSNSS